MHPIDRLLTDVPLAPRTTLGVGGPARFLAEAHTPEATRAALAWARDRGVPVLVLGGGSNLLVADRGVDALVLCVHIGGVEVYTSGDTVHVTAGAGEPWDPFVERTVAAGWAGLECLSGIPGTAGATPIQNVGAYGQDVSETIERVLAVDRATLETVAFSAADCGFGYRDSAFKRALAGRFVLTSVTFRLTAGGAPALRYAELARALGLDEAASGPKPQRAARAQAGVPAPTLAEVRAAVLALRRAKSMVFDPSDENHRSAGSFFTNPVVTADVLAGARAAAQSVCKPGEAMPEFPAGPGLTKLSAGWLIERAGFPRGASDGPVGLSTRHALALVNRGGATAAQLVAFARRVKQAVFDRFGVSLVPEPVLCGFTPDETAALLSPS